MPTLTPEEFAQACAQFRTDYGWRGMVTLAARSALASGDSVASQLLAVLNLSSTAIANAVPANLRVLVAEAVAAAHVHTIMVHASVDTSGDEDSYNESIDNAVGRMLGTLDRNLVLLLGSGHRRAVDAVDDVESGEIADTVRTAAIYAMAEELRANQPHDPQDDNDNDNDNDDTSARDNTDASRFGGQPRRSSDDHTQVDTTD